MDSIRDSIVNKIPTAFVVSLTFCRKICIHIYSLSHSNKTESKNLRRQAFHYKYYIYTPRHNNRTLYCFALKGSISWYFICFFKHFFLLILLLPAAQKIFSSFINAQKKGFKMKRLERRKIKIQNL